MEQYYMYMGLLFVLVLQFCIVLRVITKVAIAQNETMAVLEVMVNNQLQHVEVLKLGSDSSEKSCKALMELAQVQKEMMKKLDNMDKSGRK